MATGVDIKQKAELEKWLVKINPSIAQQLRTAGAWWEAEEKKDPENKQLKKAGDAAQAAILSDAKLEAKREADAKDKEKGRGRQAEATRGQGGQGASRLGEKKRELPESSGGPDGWPTAAGGR